MNYLDMFWIWYISVPLSEILMWLTGIGTIVTGAYLVFTPNPYENRRNNG